MITRNSVRERLCTKKAVEPKKICYNCEYFKSHDGVAYVPNWCCLNDQETEPDNWCDDFSSE